MKLFPVISFVVMAILGLGVYFYSQSNDMIQNTALQIGNVSLWIITLISYIIISNSLKSTNPNAMIRAKMSGTILKFFAVIGLVLLFVFTNNTGTPDKTNIFFFGGMYVIYAGLEAAMLSTQAKKHNKYK